MKYWPLLLFMLWGIPAVADSTCNTGSGPTVGTCKPGVSYGVSIGASDVDVIDPDPNGARNCLWLHAYNTNTNNICIARGVAASTTTPPNCIVELGANQLVALYNFPTGNGAFQVWNDSIHAISEGGTQSLAFSYCR